MTAKTRAVSAAGAWTHVLDQFWVRSEPMMHCTLAGIALVF
jgi:hypothetical protein